MIIFLGILVIIWIAVARMYRTDDGRLIDSWWAVLIGRCIVGFVTEEVHPVGAALVRHNCGFDAPDAQAEPRSTAHRATLAM